MLLVVFEHKPYRRISKAEMVGLELLVSRAGLALLSFSLNIAHSTPPPIPTVSSFSL